MERTRIILLTAGLIASFTGCTTPQESGVGDGPSGNETRRDDGTLNRPAMPEYLVIANSTYECDGMSMMGLCDGYELDEGQTADDASLRVTPNADGSLAILGVTYRCSNIDRVDIDAINTTDTAGKCEYYERIE